MQTQRIAVYVANAADNAHVGLPYPVTDAVCLDASCALVHTWFAFIVTMTIK